MSKSKIEALKKLQASLAEQSHWDDVKNYAVRDWKQEVADDSTRLGYREWVLSMIDQDINELEVA
tara:strand:+ start:304 stop:498 length:195 start_codon:yes stop_codon:yes gene_type:complete